jgi:Asp-tRNA(Asn)/Glu-tRNA(Gln) amidotransferase B subunit
MPSCESGIGPETHIRLNTKSKVLCARPVGSWG